MKVSELEGAQLDAWVAHALGYASPASVPEQLCGTWYAGESDGGVCAWQPSTDWAQGGPIIERERISIVDIKATEGDMWSPERGQFSAFIDSVRCLDSWEGNKSFDGTQIGPTPLIAAMRAFVASKFGDNVPNE